MDIFTPRTAFKPFEYPDVVQFKDAINHSYWLVSEFNFMADIHDFRTALSDHERQIIKDTLLAISQVEVSVKRFWGRIGERFPKPEIEQIGATFSESEVRHADAYSHLLQVLGLNSDFEGILNVRCIRDRVYLLNQSIIPGSHISNRDFVFKVATFSSFVENVSLFAQFAIIKAFNKETAVLKDIDNVVQATQKEETIHAMFGQWVVHQVRQEHPEWFDEDFENRLWELAQDAYHVECGIIDWIFRDGELYFLPADALKMFVKQRLNESLLALGSTRQFQVIDEEVMAPLKWFDEELHADVHTDFFHKRPVTYSKKSRPITAGDLF